jgi:hypothetical protein
MSNPYVLDYVHNGRSERVLDRRRLAADLAPLLGGTLEPITAIEAEDSRSPADLSANLRIGDLLIHLNRDKYSRPIERIHVSAGPLRPASIRLAGASRQTYPECTLDSGRPLDALAKAIRSRVIEPAATPLAADLAKVRAMVDNADGLAKVRAELLARFPAMDRQTANGLAIAEPERDGRDAYLSAAGNGFSLSGRLKADGSLYVDRLSLNRPAAELLAWLFERPAG